MAGALRKKFPSTNVLTQTNLDRMVLDYKNGITSNLIRAVGVDNLIKNNAIALEKDLKTYNELYVDDYEIYKKLSIHDLLNLYYSAMFAFDQTSKNSNIEIARLERMKSDSAYLIEDPANPKTYIASTFGVNRYRSRLNKLILDDYKLFITNFILRPKSNIIKVFPSKIKLAETIEGLRLQAKNIEDEINKSQSALDPLLLVRPPNPANVGTIDVLTKRIGILETQLNVVNNKIQEEESKLGLVELKARKTKLKQKEELKRKEEIEMDQREELEDAIRASVKGIIKQYGGNLGYGAEEKKREKLAKEINKTAEKLAEVGIEYQGRGIDNKPSKSHKKIRRMLTDYLELMDEEPLYDEEMFLKRLKKMKEHFPSKRKTKRVMTGGQRNWMEFVDALGKKPKYAHLKRKDLMKVASTKYKKQKQ